MLKEKGLIKKALENNPNEELYRCLGKIYIDEKNFVDAINCYKQAIKLNSECYDAWFFLALALTGNKQIDDAIIAYQKALLVKPEEYTPYGNLGKIYYNIKNDVKMAIKCFEEMSAYFPGNARVKEALGYAYLKAKNYKKGWELFEYRHIKEIIYFARTSLWPNSPIKTKPIWFGEYLRNKTIYVYYEEGFADSIMFSRFLPLLKSKCKEILFRPKIGSIELFKENPLDATILDTSIGEEELNFDFHALIMSLPALLQINSEQDIPLSEGYLKSNPEKVNAYKQKYFNNNKFKIGINGQSGKCYGDAKNIPPECFYGLFDLPNTQFYSLQKGDCINQLASKNIIELGSTFKDLSDTAAAIENLDLVICNDSDIAHLAGALGKKCWLLLPFVQDWRWSTDLSYCPWYKSVKFFKQYRTGNWKDVFIRIYEDLQNEIASSPIFLT